MGQSTSAAGKIILNGRRTKLLSSKSPIETDESEVSPDYTSYIPDECLALVFQFLNSGNRKRCALVCRRWMIVEGRNRHRLSLHARSGLITSIPSLFSRFDSVVKLSLKCDRRSVSINDEALAMISLRCRNLKRLKLRACRELTYKGMATFAENCKGLNILSCGSCDFGAEGVKAVLDHCSSLEELSIKRLRNFTDSSHEPIGPGLAASSLKSICLKALYIGECFGPVIAGAKNLRSLKLFRCSGDWDMVLEEMAVKEHGIVEIHLERMQVTDVALAAISNCSSLESLHLVKTPECTNGGLAGIAEKCKCLRKLHIDGWKANLIGDEGLVAVAKFCSKLQELVLIGVNPTTLSLAMLAVKSKCPSLRKLCIKNCPISDLGIENLANGCPGLIKVKIKKCRGVMGGCADWLRTVRPMLSVNADTVEPEGHEEGSNDAVEGGLQENRIEFPSLNSQIVAPSLASSSRSRSGYFKSRVGLFSGISLVACTLRQRESS
ncbi:F-box protein At1g47056-like isoform X2 [Brassica napus]|uniref:F-box protein At1g47056-like isoform X2 n=1 Tax=Brassica napus TaxID=3708 RepID=UPI0020785219|nr:F-box protein At1g47056-like isoform X2 [Brassica napus]XP_048628949.1 F-box protein At1g47056-like isoform X2 [Brassica napus]